MIFKRVTHLISIIMAFVLIMACVVPTGAEIVEKLPEKNASSDALGEALNVPGGTLTFTTEEYPFEPVTDGDRYCVESTNEGIYNSSSLLKTTVTVSAGDVLSFDYLFAWKGENFLALYVVNEAGEEVRPFSVSQSDETWKTASYTFPAAGEYDLTWQYFNDYSTYGYARLDNVQIVHPLDEALNVPGGSLEFTTEEYPFVAVDDGERYYAQSTNEGIDVSSSLLKTTVTVSSCFVKGVFCIFIKC